jgi:hypothetical protein
LRNSFILKCLFTEQKKETKKWENLLVFETNCCNLAYYLQQQTTRSIKKHFKVVTTGLQNALFMGQNQAQKAINERFIVVYKLLEERGEIVPSRRDKSKSVFAEKITGKRGYGHLIDKYLTGERCITTQGVDNLCKHYGVNKKYMLCGEEPIFLDEMSIRPLYRSAEELPQGNGNIVHTSVRALASTALTVDSLEKQERFSIPGVSGDLFSFEVEGNSMSPTLEEGDLLICRKLESTEKIKDNQIYTIVANSGVMVKRIKRILNKKGELMRYKLISDNYLEHDPFELPLSEIREILKVERRLTSV